MAFRERERKKKIHQRKTLWFLVLSIDPWKKKKKRLRKVACEMKFVMRKKKKTARA